MGIVGMKGMKFSEQNVLLGIIVYTYLVGSRGFGLAGNQDGLI